MKKRSHPKVIFKWSSVDQVLLPALSGVVKTFILTLRYNNFQIILLFFALIFGNLGIIL